MREEGKRNVLGVQIDAIDYERAGVRANVLGTVLNDFGKRETSNDSAHRYNEYAGAYHDARLD